MHICAAAAAASATCANSIAPRLRACAALAARRRAYRLAARARSARGERWRHHGLFAPLRRAANQRDEGCIRDGREANGAWRKRRIAPAVSGEAITSGAKHIIRRRASLPLLVLTACQRDLNKVSGSSAFWKDAAATVWPQRARAYARVASAQYARGRGGRRLPFLRNSPPYL